MKEEETFFLAIGAAALPPLGKRVGAVQPKFFTPALNRGRGQRFSLPSAPLRPALRVAAGSMVFVKCLSRRGRCGVLAPPRARSVFLLARWIVAASSACTTTLGRVQRPCIEGRGGTAARPRAGFTTVSEKMSTTRACAHCMAAAVKSSAAGVAPSACAAPGGKT